VARAFRRHAAGATFAVLLALTPLFVRNDTSDANNIPALLWLAAGLSLWQAFLAGRASLNLAAAACAVAVTALAAVTLAHLVARWRRAALVAGALVAASAVPTAWTLWAPTNDDEEERLIRDALRVVPARPFVLVRLSSSDRDTSTASRLTHDHFPEYLFTPPVRRGTVLSIEGWEQRSPGVDATAEAYYYQGVRCYARFRFTGTPPPRGDNLQPACERMRRRYELHLVIEREIVNRGDVWLSYYGDAPTLRVGLFRIGAPRPEAAAESPAASSEG
jgi:hypothetical protein